MHPVIVLGIVALIVALLATSWLRRNPPAITGPVLQRALIGLAVFVLIALALTGRLHWLVALLGAGIPFVLRALAALRLAKAAKGPTPGQKSDVETRYLRMSLDHDTGMMVGEVLDGPFRGRRIDDLSVDELLQLLDECVQVDAPSAELLETYLDRAHGEAWRDRATARNSNGGGSMGRSEAFEILGLGENATTKEIIDAHRRLMQKLHPDRGGSSYLASQINRAKDVLLGT